MDVQAQYNYLLKNSEAINMYCKPFFEKHKLNYFSYGRLESNGAFSCLVTNPEWYRHFWEVKHQFIIPAPNDPAKKDYFYLWSEGLSEYVVADALNNYGMANGITLIYKNEEHTKYFTFTACRDNHHAISFYLNNLNVLQSFAAYFLDQAQDLVLAAQKHSILIPEISSSKLQIESALSFGTHIKKKNAQFGASTIVELTQREVDCINCLRKGYTVKEIAKVLSLSPRTIEDRLNIIKNKLGCFRKSQIITHLDAMTSILLTD